MRIILITSIIVSCACLYTSPCTAVQMDRWSGMRDGALYMRMATNQQAQASYKNIWAYEGSQDRLYFQAPDGELLSKIILLPIDNASLPTRTDTLTASRGSGDYRLDVTGYSHRETTVVPPAVATPSVFEPAKVHMSLNLPVNNVSLYFNVPGNVTSFTFNARFETSGGSNNYILVAPSGKRYYFTPDSTLPYATKYHSNLLFRDANFESGTWEVIFVTSGKAAFWLDCIPNLFAYRPENLFVPEFLPASTTITLSDTVAGTTPLLGVAVESIVFSSIYENALQALNPDMIHYYQTPSRAASAVPPQRADVTGFNAQEEYIIFSPPTGTTILPVADFLAGLQRIRNGITNAGHTQDTFISAYDEPNLRFTLDDFIGLNSNPTNHYGPLIDAYRNADPSLRLPLMAPESSFFMDGPFLSNNASQKGTDWLAAYVSNNLVPTNTYHPPMIAWHEWMHRDLIRTDYYTDVINHAAGRFSNINGQTPLLSIPQTNVSSGSSTSAYDQDTFFTSLWMSSMFAHAANTGKLHALGWFMFTDQSQLHLKGLLSISDNENDLVNMKASPKPVYYTYKMILDNKLDTVLTNNSTHGDLAVTSMTNATKDRIVLLITNISPRTITTNLQVQTAGFSLVTTATMHTLTEGATAPQQKTISNLQSVTIDPSSVNMIFLNR